MCIMKCHPANIFCKRKKAFFVFHALDCKKKKKTPQLRNIDNFCLQAIIIIYCYLYEHKSGGRGLLASILSFHRPGSSVGSPVLTSP